MSEIYGVPVASGAPLAAPLATVDAVIIAAMDEEIAPFEQRANQLAHPRHVGMARSVIATIAGRQLLLIRSGIGAVNAATATVLAIHAVRTPLVVSTGSAGGLATGVRVGDVAVGDEYAFGGADASAFGYVPGQIPGMAPTFPGHPALVERARHRPGVLVGTMVSGDSFVDARNVETYRTRFPRALTTDMETTAVAQVCYSFGTPFLSVRGVSDLCGPIADEDFTLAIDTVAALAADVTLDLIDVPAPVANG